MTIHLTVDGRNEQEKRIVDFPVGVSNHDDIMIILLVALIEAIIIQEFLKHICVCVSVCMCVCLGLCVFVYGVGWCVLFEVRVCVFYAYVFVCMFCVWGVCVM